MQATILEMQASFYTVNTGAAQVGKIAFECFALQECSKKCLTKSPPLLTSARLRNIPTQNRASGKRGKNRVNCCFGVLFVSPAAEMSAPDDGTSLLDSERLHRVVKEKFCQAREAKYLQLHEIQLPP